MPAHPIDLGGSNNVNNIVVSNSGRNNITINDTGTAPLNISGTSVIGSGRLTIHGGSGGITESGTFADIEQAANAGPITLSSASGPIDLNQANSLSGQIDITGGSNQSITLTNASDPLTLGDIATAGTGTFTATASGDAIVQAPGTVLSLSGGIDSFTAAGNIDLANQGNSFNNGSSAVALVSMTGNDAVVASSALQLGNVNTPTSLQASAQSPITQASAMRPSTPSSSNLGSPAAATSP